MFSEKWRDKVRTPKLGRAPTPCWEASEAAPLDAAANGLLGIACLSDEAGREVVCERERANWWAAALSAAAPIEGGLPATALLPC